MTHTSSGYCGTGVHNSHKFRVGTRSAAPVLRVLWHGVYITHRSSRYGHERPTELTAVPGTGMKVLHPKVPGIVAWAYITYISSGRVQEVLHPYAGYCGAGCTELTEVPGTGINVLQNSQQFRVRV